VNYFCPGDTNKLQPVPYSVGPPRLLGETAEPQMGLHWIDITAPELDPVNPKVFTETFVYGSFDGKVNYLEPMVTLDFIRHTSYYSRAIPRPAKVQITGYYPTTMTLMRNFGDFVIVLGDMEYRVQQ
jgi:hypothetical protein